MSMPSFPPCGANVTKDEALTMIVASIAMEELALSHIVNAEGEKLQYILGTLPGGREACANTQEILAVNKSVKELLDTVTQNQMLLKGKLEKALEAGGRPPAPEPPPCGPRPDRPPCGGRPCPEKSVLQLSSRCGGLLWENDSLMAWTRREQTGRAIHWDEKNPALIGLDPGKAYLLSYTINIRDSCPGDRSGAILVKPSPQDALSPALSPSCASVPPLYFSVRPSDCEPLTLHYSAVLFPQACPPARSGFSLLLRYRERLFVEQAALSVVEL